MDIICSLNHIKESVVYRESAGQIKEKTHLEFQQIRVCFQRTAAEECY